MVAAFPKIRKGDAGLGGAPDPQPTAFSRDLQRSCGLCNAWLVEAWEHTLTVGQPLPTLPLWLADDLAIPLDLEQTYEDTCRVLRIP